MAHPDPVRAAALREKLEMAGIKTHEKTVGMTLYRLLREGKLRREGWDWFFIPEAERGNASSPNEQQESPGSDPGLLLAPAQ